MKAIDSNLLAYARWITRAIPTSRRDCRCALRDEKRGKGSTSHPRRQIHLANEAYRHEKVILIVGQRHKAVL